MTVVRKDMAFTYDLTASGDDLLISKVRLVIPDNDSTAYELEDAEITYFLDQVADNINGAAVLACQMLARRYAQKVGFTADGATVRYGERARAFAERAAELAQSSQGGISSVTLDRSDGFADQVASGEYASRTVYVKV